MVNMVDTVNTIKLLKVGSLTLAFGSKLSCWDGYRLLFLFSDLLAQHDVPQCLPDCVTCERIVKLLWLPDVKAKQAVKAVCGERGKRTCLIDFFFFFLNRYGCPCG